MKRMSAFSKRGLDEECICEVTPIITQGVVDDYNLVKLIYINDPLETTKIGFSKYNKEEFENKDSTWFEFFKSNTIEPDDWFKRLYKIFCVLYQKCLDDLKSPFSKTFD